MANNVNNPIGTSGQIIGRYERLEMVPSIKAAGKIADVVGVTFDYLVDDTGKFSELKDKAILKRLTDVDLVL